MPFLYWHLYCIIVDRDVCVFDWFVADWWLQEWFSQYVNFIEINEMPCKEIFETMTFDLLEYLECRRIDPCNVLVGRPPSQRVVRTLRPLLDNDVNDDSACERERDKGVVPNVYDLLQRWSSIGMYSHRVVKEITSLFGKIKSKVHYQRGELVVARIESIPEQYRFVRFILTIQWFQFIIYLLVMNKQFNF